MIEFVVHTTDQGGFARLGLLTTRRSRIETPVFMPVGSLGAVKGIEAEDLSALGYGVILNNAYHLYLRPGHELIAEMGGLHRYASWPHSILTDSGGFQVFSLSKLCRVTDEGVTFQSHVDGSLHHITPERSIAIQEALGADIIMAFDECVALPSSRERVEEAVQRTARWAQRCRTVQRSRDQALFGIVQGGHDPELRLRAATDIVAMGFDGYAVGGLSVGEEKAVMYDMLDVTVPALPPSQPRYLMGVGMPEDLVEGVARGIDLFDCVVPTRHGRTGWLFTAHGRIVIKQAKYARDERPIDPSCGCRVCGKYSRAYLHHLFLTKEMLGVRLNTLHNLFYFAELMRRIRAAIAGGTFAEFRVAFHAERTRGQDDAGLVESPSHTQEGSS